MFVHHCMDNLLKRVTIFTLLSFLPPPFSLLPPLLPPSSLLPLSSSTKMLPYFQPSYILCAAAGRCLCRP